MADDSASLRSLAGLAVSIGETQEGENTNNSTLEETKSDALPKGNSVSQSKQDGRSIVTGVSTTAIDDLQVTTNDSMSQAEIELVKDTAKSSDASIAEYIIESKVAGTMKTRVGTTTIDDFPVDKNHPMPQADFGGLEYTSKSSDASIAERITELKIAGDTMQEPTAKREHKY